MFIHEKAAVLIRKMQNIADKHISLDQRFNSWFRGQDRPPSKSKLKKNSRSIN